MFKKEKKYLYLTPCAIHLPVEMKEAYSEINAKTITIPGGCTKFLQPLDATVINSFKRHCEKHRIDTEIELYDKKTKKGNIKPIDRQLLINIISKG